MDTVLQLLKSQAEHYKSMQSAKFEEGKDLSSLFIVLEQEFNEAIKILNEAIVKRSESCATCKYYKPDNNPMCSSCFARDKHVLAT